MISMNLAVFDLEGTLVKEEFLVELGRAVGEEKEIEKITKLGLEGKINWENGLKNRIEILRGLEHETIAHAARKFTYREGAFEAIRFLRENNFEIAIITGGFGISACEISKNLGINFLACNELKFENGKLAGVTVNVNGNKDEWLRFFADKLEAKITLAFGDGANDFAMLEAATYGKLLCNGENLHKEVERILNIFKPAIKIGMR
ncbi:MAG TPA: HAD family phosphatase [archaeon]|nr:HAD family phosphatase [archaeon]